MVALVQTTFSNSFSYDELINNPYGPHLESFNFSPLAYFKWVRACRAVQRFDNFHRIRLVDMYLIWSVIYFNFNSI